LDALVATTVIAGTAVIANEASKRFGGRSPNSHANITHSSADPVPFPEYIEWDRLCGLASLRFYNDCIASGRGHTYCGPRATVCYDACVGGEGQSAAACRLDEEENSCGP
jgi:hypothetical protein